MGQPFHDQGVTSPPPLTRNTNTNTRFYKQTGLRYSLGLVAQTGTNHPLWIRHATGGLFDRPPSYFPTMERGLDPLRCIRCGRSARHLRNCAEEPR